MGIDEALSGKEIPPEIRDTLVLVSLPYVSFTGDTHTGFLVVHRDLESSVRRVFAELYRLRFTIKSITPIVAFEWDDDVSMSANNTSAFNYRNIALTNRLSLHAFGRAIDINPMQNPYTQRDGKVVPTGATYDPSQPGTITPAIAALFKSEGFTWGGDWDERKDWQHFERAM